VRAENRSGAGFPVHPLVLAVYPSLALYGLNPAETSPLEIVRSVTLSGALALLLWGLFYVMNRDGRRSALFTSCWVLAFFFWGPCSPTVLWILGREDHGMALPLYLFPFVVGSLTIRKVKSLRGLTQAANVFTASLLAATLVPSLGSRAAWSGFQLSGLTGVSAGKHEASSTYPLPNGRPDVFFLVLDGYGRSDTLKRLYSLDNRPFLDEMARRGFWTAERSRSNYSQTLLSLTSCLNFQYLQGMDLPDVSSSSKRLAAMLLLRNNRIFREFRGMGYHIISLQSAYAVSDMAPFVDQYVPDPWALSEFENVLLSMTLLHPLTESLGLYPQYDQHRRSAVRFLDQLGSMGAPVSDRPRFVFAHACLPHPPFVWGKDGEAVNPSWPLNLFDGSFFYGKTEDYRQGYGNQLQALNGFILSTTDKLLKEAGPNSIIIILSDHGPGSHLDWKNPKQVDYSERFQNLILLRIPGMEPGSLRPDMTPVNLFRLILNERFGRSLPLLEDRSYHSTWEQPFEFLPVGSLDQDSIRQEETLRTME